MKNRSLIVMTVVLAFVLFAGMALAATHTPQEITTSGLNITPETTVATANEFDNDGSMFLYLNNGSGATLYYTVTVPGQIAGFSIEDITGSVANGVTEYVGPFDPTYCNAADGNVDYALSTTSSVSVAVLELDY